MPITYYDTTGQSLYVMFDDGSNTAVDLTEGSSLNAGRYSVADSAIATASLGAGEHNYRILEGVAASKSASDPHIASGAFAFDGTNEVAPDANVASMDDDVLTPASVDGDTFDGLATTQGQANTIAAVGTVGSNLTNLAAKFAGITALAGWLRLLARSDAAVLTDEAVSLAELNADGGSGAGGYSNAADSLEANQAAVSSVSTAVNQIESEVGEGFAPHPDQVWVMRRRGERVGSRFPITKQPGEELTVYADVQHLLGVGEGLGGVETISVTEQGSAGVTVLPGSIEKSGTQIKCVLVGGSDGVDTRIQFTFESTVNPGKPLQADGPLLLRD